MTATDTSYTGRDPFFCDSDPQPDPGPAAERWTAALKVANTIDQRLPGIMIDMAGGMTQAAAARRAGMEPSTVCRAIQKLRASRSHIKPCDMN